MMTGKKALDDNVLGKVTGGAGCSRDSVIIGMDNYDKEQSNCPKCGSKKLSYKTFVADDGKTTKIGQLCECGHSWTFGNKTGIK